jgi:hypothetical protein
VHYLPAGARLPDPGGRRWAVAAIPWTFGILLRRRAWFDGAARADFVHSTAVLPSAAFDLLDAVHARGRAGWLLELFGSTETGAGAAPPATRPTPGPCARTCASPAPPPGRRR